MLKLLQGVTNGSGTINSASFIPQEEAMIHVPADYDGDTLALDSATGYVQVRLPDGTFVDYVDGASGEEITGAVNKLVKAQGLELRVQFRNAAGAAVIPLVAVSGNARPGSQRADAGEAIT